jgi:predicted nuclease of predicted toxin-antitoxin system
MSKAASKLAFFLDNNVPDSIGRFLQRRGHSVWRQCFYIPADSPDPLVAMTALTAGRILITQDKDFNSQRFQRQHRQTQPR